MNFTLWFVGGMAAAIPYLIWAIRLDDDGERTLLGVGLIIATGVWLMFSALYSTPKWMAIEIIGVIAYGTLAVRGAGQSYLLLGVGWALHSLWDIVLHVTGPGYRAVTEPAGALWYSVACLSFDLLVAIYIVFRLTDKQQRSQASKVARR